MNIKSKVKVAITSTIALVTLLGSPLAVYAGYAPANRPTYQCTTPTNCDGPNHVVFNSFTNAPNYGDERAFFDGKDAGITGSGGYQDNIAVKKDQKLVLRVYIHNNADPKDIGEAAATAKNTRLQVLLPTSKKTSNTAAAQITADNANPGTVSDTVDFNSSAAFGVSFDRSAPVQITYRPNGTGDFVTRTLPSAAFSNDHTLNANFGDWKGCFEYSALVTMTVKVQVDDTPPPPAYSCDAFNITADVNRQVKISEFRYSATNGAVFKNATVNWGDGSPQDTHTSLVGKTHQYPKDRDGTYTIRATARFTVNGQEVTASGPNCVRQISFKGDNIINPPTPPETKNPTVLPNAGPGEVAAIFAAVTGFGTALYRRILSRQIDLQ